MDIKHRIATNASTIEWSLLCVKRLFDNPYQFLPTLRYNTFVFITNNTSRKTFELKLQKHEYEIK